MRTIFIVVAFFFALAPIAEGATTPFLDFPLSCPSATQGKCSATGYIKGAYTPASMISVLDHHMEKPYGDDGVVTAFTGEEGRATASKPKVNQGCYPQYSPNPGKSFSIMGLYIGSNDGCLADQGLNYDNHPAYDYKAQVGTPVYAAASGKVVRIVNKATGFPGRCVPKGVETGGCGIWGYVGIDHGNGYITQYGHLSRIDFVSGDEVKAGALIGLTGQSSPPKKDKNGKITNLYNVPPHFHFEVLKENAGSPYGYAFVDPYGWEGSPKDDPLEKATGIPNVQLWKTGAQANPAEPKVSVAPNVPLSSTAAPPVSAQTYQNPFAYCKAVVTIDMPDKRYTGTEPPPAVANALGHTAVTWRCADGQVLGCYGGASGRACEKMQTSRTPSHYIVQFCVQNPNSDFVPMAWIGNSSSTWKCNGSVPAILKTYPVDKRSFQVGSWKPVITPKLITTQVPPNSTTALPKRTEPAGRLVY
ncbi:MAG: M23 family metallopeptidase [Sterolibacteriaceae bacterium]|uniref:M23 family metallopeptidase n=1 Tax=Candidatus Methylophosphatis roskildensis TaxID=2899263 RepID=A0A9D7E3U7_9PROT|nr:M23 family metallopeptidase [Candidatus Methylophosphatis roskildensis]MBK7238192.1 M23 family metallopeptidase [Sterolibacteriaceae bacterium]